MDSKECILIVDDEESQRKTLSLILKKKGYSVESAGTGKEALEKARGRTINVSLLDIKLPDTDGTDLVAPLKQINPDMAIIMVTGFASVENTVHSLNAGASGYLIKPINNDELLTKVQDSLERQALIREKRQAEEALEESEAKFRTLFEGANDAIFIMNSTVFLDCNHSTEGMYGCTRDQIIGHSPAEFSPERQPDGRLSTEKAQEKIDAAMSGEPRFFEWVHTRYDRTPFDAEVTLNRIMLKGNYYLQAIVRDITQRKQADELVRLLSRMSDDAPASITVHDFDGNFLYANEETFRLHGYTREEYLAKDLHEIDVPESEQLIATRMQQIRDTGEADFDVQHFRKDGSMFPLHVNAKIVDWGGRKVLLSIATDLTGRKRAEEALRQANKQLNLLSSITRHDILNQLIVLKGYLELSRDYLGDNKTLSDFLAKEEKAANTIEHQIRFTKDYQELGVTAPEWQSVNASIDKALSKLPMRAVLVEVDPKNPEVFADLLFEKVFYNLIDNALKYGSDQMKTIRFCSQESDRGLTIICEDDGVGITTEDKKKLFTKGFGKNTGLGLFLSREILAITGITITENGIPGKGARFEIHVPAGMWRMKGASA